MPPVRANIANCPSISEGGVSTVITVAFVPDAILSSDESMTLEWWRRRSEDGGCLWASYAQEE